jgi:hypothetical protein
MIKEKKMYDFSHSKKNWEKRKSEKMVLQLTSLETE